MKSLHIFLYLIVASLFITSCSKEEEGMIINNNQTQTTVVAGIFGQVIDENDRPVENALVTFNSNNTLTDKNGIYTFSNATIGNRHNSVKIEKAGFFDGARTFRTSNAATQYQVTKLLTKSFDQSFETSTGGDLSVANQTIQFSPNSIAFDSDGSAYQGTVQVAISPIAADAPERGLIMPGDLSAMDNEGNITTLESYGMINVELRSPSGDKLQIANGMTAILGIELTPEQLQTAPSTIDLWSFDFDSGLWDQEGTAILDGNTYTGEVTHFSSWNYDLSLPSIIVEGRLLLEQSGLRNFYVSIHNDQDAGGHGFTDVDGYFSGRVPKDQLLTLKVLDFSCNSQNSLLYETEVGPFNQDTDLGDIDIITNLDLLTLTGTALNCDLEIVTDGNLRVGGGFMYPIIDGSLDFAIPVCGSGAFDIVITDREALKETTIADVTFPGMTDLMDVVVCTTDADFLSIENFFPEVFNLTDSLALYVRTNDADVVTGDINGYEFSEFVEIGMFLKFEIGNAFAMDELEEDTYSLTDSRMTYSDDIGTKENYVGNQGSVTISNITSINASSQSVEGSYIFEATEVDTQEEKTLTGNFKIIQFK